MRSCCRLFGARFADEQARSAHRRATCCDQQLVRSEQDRRHANVVETEIDEFVGVEVTVGNRCDSSPGEAGQLTTAGIELGADVWFPRIERFRRGEVV